MTGTLGIQIGFQEYELHPGDSVAFDSTTPHRLFNTGDVPVHAIWFVVGRDANPHARSRFFAFSAPVEADAARRRYNRPLMPRRHPRQAFAPSAPAGATVPRKESKQCERSV